LVLKKGYSRDACTDFDAKYVKRRGSACVPALVVVVVVVVVIIITIIITVNLLYLDVGDARQGGPGCSTHGGRREDGQQADGDARRRRLHVDPERHPGQNDDQYRRHVDLDQEEPDVAAQVELHLLTREVA